MTDDTIVVIVKVVAQRWAIDIHHGERIERMKKKIEETINKEIGFNVIKTEVI